VGRFPTIARRRLLAASVAGLVALTTAPRAAYACFGSNEGAIRNFIPPANSKGIKQIVDLVDVHPTTGDAIAHPIQVTEPGSCGTNCDFFGLGTYRSTFLVGSNCSAANGSSWLVYVDGSRFGVYFCSVLGAVAGSAQNQTFTIRYTSCAPTDPLRWVFYLNGTQKACYTNSFTATDWMGGGGEGLGTISGDTLPINIFYQDSYYLDTTSTFRTWSGTLNVNVFNCADSGYQVRNVAFPFQYWTEIQ
jgi:hypothetical protein